MKKTLTRLLTVAVLSCLMAFAMIPSISFADDITEYNIWVGATKVTSANMNDILGDGVRPSTIRTVRL